MRRNKLDYSYGAQDEDEKATGFPIESDADDDSLTVRGKKGTASGTAGGSADKKRSELARPPPNTTNNKYLLYQEFLENDDYETNGYKYDKDDNFDKLDLKGWNTFVGFMLIRIASPIFLLVHAIALGVYVWMKGFDFSVNGPLASGPYGGVGAIILVSLSFHAFLVHGFNKWLFRRTYWKKRVDHEADKKSAQRAKESEAVESEAIGGERSVDDDNKN